MLVFHGKRLFLRDGWKQKLENIDINVNSNWFALTPGKAVSLSEITNCYRVNLADNSAVYFKSYTYINRKRNRYFCRPAKAAVEAFGYARLRKIGIAVPNIVALAEQRWFGFLRASLIVTEEVHGSTSLVFLHQQWLRMPADQKRFVFSRISKRLAAQLGMAHRAHFFHHDLHWRNILIITDGDEYQPVWIDCPRAARLFLRARHAAIKDISNVVNPALEFLSARDSVELLKIYMGPRYSRAAAKELMARVWRHTKK